MTSKYDISRLCSRKRCGGRCSAANLPFLRRCWKVCRRNGARSPRKMLKNARTLGHIGLPHYLQSTRNQTCAVRIKINSNKKYLFRCMIRSSLLNFMIQRRMCSVGSLETCISNTKYPHHCSNYHPKSSTLTI